MVTTAMVIEREIEDARVSGMRVLVARGRRAKLRLVWERSQRLPVHEGFRDRTATMN